MQRVAALRGAWHLLVLSEDWCGDAVNTRAGRREARRALAEPGSARAGARRESRPHGRASHRHVAVDPCRDRARRGVRERGWWGPRPAALQQWVLGDGQALEQGRPLPRGAQLVRARSRAARRSRRSSRCSSAASARADRASRVISVQRGSGRDRRCPCVARAPDRSRSHRPAGVSRLLHFVRRRDLGRSGLAGVSITNTTRRFSSAPGWSPDAPRLTERVLP